MKNLHDFRLYKKYTYGQLELTLKIIMKIGLFSKDSGDYSQSDYLFIPDEIKLIISHLLDVLKLDPEEDACTATLYWLLAINTHANIGEIKIWLDVKDA